MANWHAVDLDFPNHRKTLHLERILGTGRSGHVLLLWLWACSYRSNGDLSGMTDEEIEAAARWSGTPGALTVTLVKVGFLDGVTQHFLLHGWRQRNKYFAKEHRNRQTALRMRRYRDRVTKTSPSVTRYANVTPTRSDQRGEDQIRSEKRRTTTPAHQRRELVNGYSAGFLKFWEVYPSRRKTAKPDAFKSWTRQGCESITDQIIASVEAHKTWPDWKKSDGDFIPGPTPFLNKRRWEDEGGAAPDWSEGV